MAITTIRAEHSAVYRIKIIPTLCGQNDIHRIRQLVTVYEKTVRINTSRKINHTDFRSGATSLRMRDKPMINVPLSSNKTERN